MSGQGHRCENRPQNAKRNAWQTNRPINQLADWHGKIKRRVYTTKKWLSVGPAIHWSTCLSMRDMGSVNQWPYPSAINSSMYLALRDVFFVLHLYKKVRLQFCSLYNVHCTFSTNKNDCMPTNTQDHKETGMITIVNAIAQRSTRDVWNWKRAKIPEWQLHRNLVHSSRFTEFIEFYAFWPW